jgi:GT2 family glycosyltransferase
VPDYSANGFPEDVSVAVIAYNGMRTLPLCIRGLVDSGCPERLITVYDVASTDGTGDWLAADHPNINVVHLDENLGPNPARNLAVKHSDKPFVLLVDVDVQLLPGTAQVLRRVIGENPSIAVATPVVLHADQQDTVHYSRTFVHFLAEASAEVDNKPLAQLNGETARVGLASGCSPMIRRETAVEIGLFEERYFFGKTDGEFAYRVTLAGRHIVEPATAQVLHHHHKRGSMYFRHQVRNRWHFMLKNFQLRTLILIFPVLLVHEPALFILLLVKGKLGDYFWAFGSMFRLLPTLRSDRRAVAKIRRVHDWQVLHGDKLVIPADINGGAFGTLASLYRVVLGGYWLAVRWVLKGLSKKAPGGGALTEDLSVLTEKGRDDGPSSRTNVA